MEVGWIHLQQDFWNPVLCLKAIQWWFRNVFIKTAGGSSCPQVTFFGGMFRVLTPEMALGKLLGS